MITTITIIVFVGFFVLCYFIGNCIMRSYDESLIYRLLQTFVGIYAVIMLVAVTLLVTMLFEAAKIVVTYIIHLL